MSRHPRHLVLAIWHSRLSGLRDRLRLMVARTGRGAERLPVAVDWVRRHPHPLVEHWTELGGDPFDVLRLLPRDQRPEGRRPGSGDVAGTRPLGDSQSRSVSGNGGTSQQVELGSSRYGPSATLGGWTYSFGPYDAEDFAPANLPYSRDEWEA